ncbi:oxidoreductase [Companilactobacillus crustorum]|uniref:Aldo/keto reductase n=2 Tax=Companilactobacillus TaxID=2767879 RepID=A0A2P4R6D0_9LACO|nr:aldo/keto reductase [Companilactobacillus crustorum]WDT65273.1 aldo/keto reductase [Companilactobacillus crustorum]GEO76566.1 oxidoreductase [Companilactobacillus crustorum]HCD08539.1 aldo/keto reductase [Lactobacillus sp.]
MDITSSYLLNNGYSIPVVGFGTILKNGTKTISAVENAISSGYRLIDSAEAYGNEVDVGDGIQRGVIENRLDRSDIFVTSKVWNDHHGYRKTIQAFETSLAKLRVGYLDLYLIHWPANKKWHKDWRELNDSTWLALEDLYRAGEVRAIGVSNFSKEQLAALIEDNDIKPMVNQLEYHPGFAQKEAAKYSQDNDVLVEAWRPFGGPDSGILNNPVITQLADKYGCSPSQVVLRWLLQQKILPLARSSNPEHMLDNLDIFDFELDRDDMLQISTLPSDDGTHFDPETYHS